MLEDKTKRDAILISELEDKTKIDATLISNLEENIQNKEDYILDFHSQRNK